MFLSSSVKKLPNTENNNIEDSKRSNFSFTAPTFSSDIKAKTNPIARRNTVLHPPSHKKTVSNQHSNSSSKNTSQDSSMINSQFQKQDISSNTIRPASANSNPKLRFDPSKKHTLFGPNNPKPNLNEPGSSGSKTRIPVKSGTISSRNTESSSSSLKPSINGIGKNLPGLSQGSTSSSQVRNSGTIQIPKPATLNSSIKPSPGATKHPISRLQSISSVQIGSQRPSMAKPSSPKLSYVSSKPTTLSSMQKPANSSINSLSRAGSLASKMSSSYTSSTLTQNPRVSQPTHGGAARLSLQQQRLLKPNALNPTQGSVARPSLRDKPKTPTNSSIHGYGAGSGFSGKGRSNTIHSGFPTPGNLKSKTHASINLQKSNLTPPPTSSKPVPVPVTNSRPLPLPGLNSKSSVNLNTPTKPIVPPNRSIYRPPIKAKITPINTSMLSASPSLTSTGLPISKSLSLSSKTSSGTTKSLLDISGSPINRHNTLSGLRTPRDGVGIDSAYRPDLPSLNGEPRRPLTPSQVLQNFKQFLSPYEWREIYNYSEIWTFGIKYPRTHIKEDSDTYAFVDSSGNFCVYPGSHVAYRYEIVDSLGKGSFGTVMKCFDHKLGIEVAIKAIRSASKFVQQAKVEIDILHRINSWDPDNTHHAIRMLDTFTFRGHKMIIFELLNMNLYDFIKFNDFQGFNENIVRKVTYQVLKCLSLLYNHNVIHCDLKPENVMINPATTAIKVIDFGSSCFSDQRVYTYIQSRFYRSPEVILEMPYGPAIDMWSLGCIIAELHSGYPIFPGSGENEQLERIMEYLGAPPLSMIMKSRRRVLFFDSNNQPRFSSYSHGKQRGPASSRSLSSFLGTKDPDFLDFVSRCLDLDPATRMTPDEALQHPWIQVSKPGTRSNSQNGLGYTHTHR